MTATQKLTKTYRYAAYAYASSDMATKLGFPKTGCWYVGRLEVLDNSLECDETVELATEDKAAAINAFKSIDAPTWRYSKFL